MFKRKLSALNYHDTETFDGNNTIHFRQLISWIEDQKIRHYKIEDRSDLRNLSDASKWQKAYEEYLKNIDCPYDAKDTQLVLEWILNFAVRLEFEDNADKYKEMTAEDVKQCSIEPKVIQQNPIDTLDFNSEEFKSGVKELSQMLKVPQHYDHLITLKAISILIKNYLEKERAKLQNNDNKSLESENKNKSLKSLESDKSKISLENCPLGFDTGDTVLNHAAKVLRLLYINDLRDLQTKINEIIVAAQSITANPKTDTALGKVGK